MAKCLFGDLYLRYMLRIGNTTELTNADAQNFRNAVRILLQKLAVQSVGGRSNVGTYDVD
ncbi:hypothetical protein FACS1894113_3330 [Alphaproteobacteria bacterium]|nr:hypothetical protein FACS1894113_3330 [Alphaproteobacteria bacterium]